MTSPVVWIVAPLIWAILLFLLPRERWISIFGAVFSVLLAWLAFWLPPDTAQRLGSLSLRIDSTLNLFGRQISLTSADQTILILVYSLAAFWFFGTLASGHARRIVPLGLMIIALLVASLAVRPFLYAALILEVAVLLAVPLLVEPRQKLGRGVLRFLVYQTLAMPFILFAGFLLSGVEAGPSDLALIAQAAVMLGLGFAFLLSIFPLYSWIPTLAEETSPYALGFMLMFFPTFSLVFGLSFMDRYSWLRDSEELQLILRSAGLLMIVSAGVWAAFQRHLGRIFAYAAIAETGISLLALSLPDSRVGLQAFFFLLIPRGLAFGVWTLSLAVLKNQSPDLKFSSLRGLARGFPIATAGIILANLALAGTPLFASFPVRQVLWEQLARESLTNALWFGLASLGLWVGALRSLAVLVMSPENANWEIGETWSQRLLIGVGLFLLLVFGLFPRWAEPLLANLSLMFQHLGQ